MTLLVIMTFQLLLYLLSVVLSCLLDGPPELDYEFIGGVAVVKTSCFSSSELRSLFTQLGLHIYAFYSSCVFGQGTSVHSCKRSLINA